MHTQPGGKHPALSSIHSLIRKLILFGLHVGTLGSLQAPRCLWRCLFWVSRNRAESLSVLATELRFDAAAVHGSAGCKLFLGGGSQPSGFNEPCLVAVLSVLLRKLLSPGTRSGMVTGNGLLPNRCSRPPAPLPSHDTLGEQSKWSQFTAGCRSYCVKLGIEVRTAGESGRLGGWRA